MVDAAGEVLERWRARSEAEGRAIKFERADVAEGLQGFSHYAYSAIIDKASVRAAGCQGAGRPPLLGLGARRPLSLERLRQRKAAQRLRAMRVADKQKRSSGRRSPLVASPIQQGTLDCLLCRNDGMAAATAAICNMHGALRSPGTLVIVSHSGPDGRLPLLSKCEWESIQVGVMAGRGVRRSAASAHKKPEPCQHMLWETGRRPQAAAPAPGTHTAAASNA